MKSFELSSLVDSQPLPRSAWKKGVRIYALELLDYSNTELPEDFSEFRKALLNGAQNWLHFSESGSALFYDSDIAERLCSLSELKKCKGGDRRPNVKEGWIEVQARALVQVCMLAYSVMRGAIKVSSKKVGE